MATFQTPTERNPLIMIIVSTYFGRINFQFRFGLFNFSVTMRSIFVLFFGYEFFLNVLALRLKEKSSQVSFFLKSNEITGRPGAGGGRGGGVVICPK